MNSRSPSFSVLAAALLLPATGLLPAVASAEERKVAVLDLAVEGGADTSVGSQLTARLAELLDKRPGFSVMSPDDVRAVLEHEGSKQRLGCDDESCLAELAGALGADLVVSGRVSKLDQAYALSVTAVDARSARALGRVSETWRGESIALLDLAEPMVDKLFSDNPAAITGTLEVSGAIDGSRVLVDEQVRGTAPAGQMGVPVGAHLVTVAADGYLPFERAVIIKRGQTTTVVAQQAEDDPPFYSTWWFWTLAAGGAVGAGATAASIAYFTLGPGASQTGVNVGVNAESAASGGR